MSKSECFYDGCGSIKKQTMDVANRCTVPDMVGEETDGCEYLFFFFSPLPDPHSSLFPPRKGLSTTHTFTGIPGRC